MGLASETWIAQGYQPTAVQQDAWRAIASHQHTLVVSPTGTGKTLAALMPVLDAWMKEGFTANPKGVYLLWVTPLRALNNDLATHLHEWIERIGTPWTTQGRPLPRVGMRTGDTPAAIRRKMQQDPPEILLTTPESLYLLLTAASGRQMLRTTRFVVVDELHQLLPDKRGAHMTLSLERLEALATYTPVRIGLSATLADPSQAAYFLGGQDPSGQPRPVTLVAPVQRKHYRLSVHLPDPAEDQPLPKADNGHKQADQRLYECIAATLTPWIRHQQRTLIFVRNRRLTERLSQQINRVAGTSLCVPHHGSLSKEVRQHAEQTFAAGQRPALIATASMELGIDIPAIDSVIHFESPWSVTAALQRFGRAGHSLGDTSQGRILVKHPAELVEALAVAQLATAQQMESVHWTQNALDVLAQQIIAAVVAAEEPVDPDCLYTLLRQAAPYAHLPKATYLRLLAMLLGHFPFAPARLLETPGTHRLEAAPGARLAALIGGGAIFHDEEIPVFHDRYHVPIGTVQEQFVLESNLGDSFVLGNQAWRITAIASDGLYVVEAGGSGGRFPFWYADGPGRSLLIGQRVGRLWRLLESRWQRHGKQGCLRLLKRRFGLANRDAQALVDEISQRIDQQGVLATDRRILVECYRDIAGAQRLLLHSSFGLRFNRTWATALRAAFEARCGQTVEYYVQDDGVLFVFPEWQPAYLEAVGDVDAQRLMTWLQQGIARTPAIGWHFREAATLALILPVADRRRHTPIWLRQWRAQQLFEEASTDPTFPLIEESWRSTLDQQFDVPAVVSLLQRIASGQAKITFIHPTKPSALARQFEYSYTMARAYGDDTPTLFTQEALRRQAAQLQSAGEREVHIDPAVQKGFEHPLVQTPAQLWRLLKTRGEHPITALSGYRRFLTDLEHQGRITRIRRGGRVWVLCSDEAQTFLRLPQSTADDPAAYHLARRFVSATLSPTPQALAERLGWSFQQTEVLWSRLVKEKLLFQQGDGSWISVPLQNRLVRLSRARALPSLQLSVGDVNRQLWQRQYVGAIRGSNPPSVETVLRRFQGLFLPWTLWMNQLLPARIGPVTAEQIDRLCLQGQLHWVARRRTSRTPLEVAFFFRDQPELLWPYAPTSPSEGQNPLIAVLQHKGACFMAELTEALDSSESETRAAIAAAVEAGQIANDQFSALAALEPSKPHGARRSRSSSSASRRKIVGQSVSVGRWYALPHPQALHTSREASLLGWAKLLLDRYGIVTRPLVEAEEAPFSWRALSAAFRALEESQGVVRGFFIEGMGELQYALPSALQPHDRTADRRTRSAPSLDEPLLLSAKDPAAWTAALESAQGRAFAMLPRRSENAVGFWHAEAVLAAQSYGHALSVPTTLPDAVWTALLRQLFTFAQQAGHRKLRIATINGQKAVATPYRAWLTSFGFESEEGAMVLWPSHAQVLFVNG
ncbi:MAG: DEAD/DEAH box helicase [Firmicutes bacterium]|nr:DEAD/DEAH box helicase [Bacillota bacterium]